MMDTLFVYDHGRHDAPAKVIRDALSKALVEYYPLAGVFVVSEEGELQVDCTGGGVWFVEAEADCTLEDVDYLDYPLKIHKEELLPQPPAQLLDPTCLITMLQITTFVCGGFVVGLSSSHAITDGTGISQFMKAVAELARGPPRPSIQPFWFRDMLPKPYHPPAGLSPTSPLKLEFSKFDISLTHINKIKNRFTEVLGFRCSTFDVIASKIWQSRTRAINFDPDKEVHLIFPIDVRNLLHDVLPTVGYYGNCIYLVTVTSTSRSIAEWELIEIVKLIKSAKDNVPTDFFKWMKGEGMNADPYKLVNSYEAFFVTDWSRVGNKDYDYGWGAPKYVRPLFELRNACLLLSSPTPDSNLSGGTTRLVTNFLKQEHLGSFAKQLLKF